MPSTGGCDFVADPRLTAAIQPIFWSPSVDPATLPLSGGTEATGGLSVHAADLQGLSTAEHDGLIRIVLGGASYDVVLSDVADARPLGAFIMFDDLTPDRLTAIERLWSAIFRNRVVTDPRMTDQRRLRARQMLRVVDARHAGATYRAVADQVFPQHTTDAASWVGSAIRETTIRLARDGMKLVSGGYRMLLRRPRRER